MYRRSLAMANEKQFLTRVGDLPVVNDSWSKVSNLYQKTKDSNRLFYFSLDLAECTMKTMSHTAQPLVGRCDGTIKMMDKFACNQLDKLQKSYPIINKPTTELIEEGQVFLKPAIERVNSVKEAGASVYNTGVYGVTSGMEVIKGVTNYGIDTAKNAASYGVNSVKGATHYGVDTIKGATSYSVNTAKDAACYGVNTVTDVTNYGMSTVKGVTNYGVNTVKGVTDYGVNTVKGVTDYGRGQIIRAASFGEEKIEQALQTTYGQVVSSQLDSILDISERYVDKYLPVDDSGIQQQDEVQARNPMRRAGALAGKLRCRMYIRALKDLQGVQARSKETLDRLNFTVDLIEYAKTNIDGARDTVRGTYDTAQNKFWETWNVITVEEQPLADGGVRQVDMVEDNSAFERRLILAARYLTQSLRRTVNTVRSAPVFLAPSVKQLYNQLWTQTETIYTSFRQVESMNQVPGWMLTQTRQTAVQLQETLSQLLDEVLISGRLNWLVPNSRKKATEDDKENIANNGANSI